MAELYRIGNVLTELEMAAAQQLMQLSDEEENSNSIIHSMKTNKEEEEEEDDDDGKSQDEITSKKIEEIFGKEDEVFDEIPRRKEVVDQRQRKRRYRSIESIYSSTIPFKVKSAKCSLNE